MDILAVPGADCVPILGAPHIVDPAQKRTYRAAALKRVQRRERRDSGLWRAAFNAAYRPPELTDDDVADRLDALETRLPDAIREILAADLPEAVSYLSRRAC